MGSLRDMSAPPPASSSTGLATLLVKSLLTETETSQAFTFEYERDF